MTTAFSTLHLTNGSAIVPRMREAGIDGTIVPWNDVLHEGPVPSGLGTAALREVRADFLASCGWASRDDILRELEQRDLTLEAAFGGPEGLHSAARTHVDEIVLWFEHDLYDQLQIVQILDRLPADGRVRLTAVTTSTYLGDVPTREYPSLFENRRVVSSVEQLAARDAWQAFRSSDPRDIIAALPRVTVLPHLAPALQRHLEQFPSVRNGLSRTEQQTLEAVASGIKKVGDVYVRANHESEEATFMGDAGFLFHISPLVNSSRPLLRILTASDLVTSTLESTTVVPSTLVPWNRGTLERSLELTKAGERVLAGELDRVNHCGIDRWLGGVHLSSRADTPIWRWDAERHTIRTSA